MGALGKDLYVLCFLYRLYCTDSTGIALPTESHTGSYRSPSSLVSSCPSLSGSFTVIRNLALGSRELWPTSTHPSLHSTSATCHTPSTVNGGLALLLALLPNGGLVSTALAGSNQRTTSCLLPSTVAVKLSYSFWYVIHDWTWQPKALTSSLQSFAVFGASGNAVDFPNW